MTKIDSEPINISEKKAVKIIFQPEITINSDYKIKEITASNLEIDISINENDTSKEQDSRFINAERELIAVVNDNIISYEKDRYVENINSKFKRLVEEINENVISYEQDRFISCEKINKPKISDGTLNDKAVVAEYGKIKSDKVEILSKRELKSEEKTNRIFPKPENKTEKRKPSSERNNVANDDIINENNSSSEEIINSSGTSEDTIVYEDLNATVNEEIINSIYESCDSSNISGIKQKNNSVSYEIQFDSPKRSLNFQNLPSNNVSQSNMPNHYVDIKSRKRNYIIGPVTLIGECYQLYYYYAIIIGRNLKKLALQSKGGEPQKNGSMRMISPV